MERMKTIKRVKRTKELCTNLKDFDQNLYGIPFFSSHE
jgi:hypothetical protein